MKVVRWVFSKCREEREKRGGGGGWKLLTYVRFYIDPVNSKLNILTLSLMKFRQAKIKEKQK